MLFDMHRSAGTLCMTLACMSLRTSKMSLWLWMQSMSFRVTRAWQELDFTSAFPEKFLRNLLMATLFSCLLYNNQPDYFAILTLHVHRILHVLVHQAAGLPWAHEASSRSSSLPDPFVVVVVNGVRVGQTSAKHSTSAPVWNEIIQVSCLDHPCMVASPWPELPSRF